MGSERPRVLILDAGALIQFERGDPKTRTLLRRAERGPVPVVIPAGVLGQVWRGGARQAPLAKLLKRRGTDVQPVGRQLAQAAGELCGRAGTADVIDATVVLEAKRRDGVVVTSDPDDLRRLDPGVELVSV